MDCELLHTKGCEWCGKTLSGRQKRWCSRTCHRTFIANHRWTQARAAAKRAATFYQCAHCTQFFRVVDVNHIVPCKGKHGVFGCHHHQNNLEVVCKPCHLKETNRQRKDGLFK